MTRRKMPSQVFVVWDAQTSDPDEQFLVAGVTLEEHASKGAKTVVGTYRLVREDVVTLVTKISQRKVRK